MVGATFEEHRREATRARLRRVTVIAFVPIAAAVPVNLLAFSDRLPERLASFGIEAALCCVAWLLTRAEWARRQAIPLAVGFVVALLTVAMWSLSLSPQDIDVLAGTVAAAMVAAALFFPWGVGPQLIVSSCAAATYVWYVPWLALDPARATNILIVLGNGLLLSSVGAALLNTQRRATFTEHMDARRAEAAQQEAARVWEAQARVARELISAVDRPALLDRLCQVTTEVLRCEAAYTLLRQPDTDAFTGMASHGFSAEEREMARMVDVPQSRMTPILSTLDDSDVGDGRTVAPKSSLGDTQPAVTSSRRLYMGLRRGEAIIGVQVARFPRRQEPFTAKERRIAAGIAQVASMALANAQAIEELERAHRLKSDFVATISHELRTPLNVILGYVEMLDDGTFGYLSTQQMEIVGRIGKSAGELFELITTTLDLSRLESGRVQVDLHDIDLGKLIAEIDAETRELQQKPDVSFAIRSS
jgi:K+-sensing histidine kinase KdpD